MSVATQIETVEETDIEEASALPLLLIAAVFLIGALAMLSGSLDMGAGAAPLQLGP